MSKSTFIVTDSWQQISTGECVVTINTKGSGNIYFNESASDAATWFGNPDRNSQFLQNDVVNTFVKCDNGTDNYEITVDGAVYSA